MRARPAFVVALALVLAGLAAYLVVPPIYGRLDRAAATEAERGAARVPDPAGAEPMTRRDCAYEPHRCFRVHRELEPTVAELAAAVRAATGQEPRRECYDSLVRTTTGQLPVTDCVLRVETGYGHGVLVQVETNVERLAPRDVRVNGTQVVIGWY